MTRKLLKPGLLGLLVALLAGYGVVLARLQPGDGTAAITLDRFQAMLADHRVVAVTLEDEDARLVVTAVDGSRTHVDLPQDGSATAPILDAVDHATVGAKARPVTATVDQQGGKATLRFLAQFLFPLLILATLFALFFALMSGGGDSEAFMGFGRILGIGRRRPARPITFADVAGADEAITELAELRDYLADPERFARMGARAPKGVLLVGPPGTGKTLLAKALAGEARSAFFAISGSEFVESLVGVGAARVRDLFAQARRARPAIIFIDELDAAGRQRGAGMGQGNDEREQTLNQMLVEMDGFGAASGIIVVGATNRPDILDPALLRPGRFDRQVVVDVPDVRGREAILRLYVRGKCLADDVDLSAVARDCPGFAGAELANLVNEAALLAIRAGREVITQDDLDDAVGRVVAGPERRSHVLTDDEKLLIARHEAGHAIVGRALRLHSGAQKLSIVARGRTLGHATAYGQSELLLEQRSQMVDRLTVLLAGVATEDLVYGETSTGGSGDIERATALAKAMVCTYGMSATLGPVMLQKGGEVFLGRDIGQLANAAPRTLERVDQEVAAVLREAETRAQEIVSRHVTLLEEIAHALVVRESLGGLELETHLAGVEPHVEVASA